MKNTISELVTDFQEGDFLYGLEVEARGKYRTAVLEKINKTREEKYPDRVGRPIYETIDKVHKAVGSKIFFTDDYVLSPRPFDTPVKIRIKTLLEAGNPFHPEQAKANQTEFNSPSDRKTIASCKQALIKHNAKVRFCLDGLDLDQARNSAQRNFNRFTSSELRFCANNWEQAQDFVVFYLDGNRIAPPWGEKKNAQSWLHANQEIVDFEEEGQNYNKYYELLAGLEIPRLGNNNNERSPICKKRLRFSFGDDRDDNSHDGAEDSSSEEEKNIRNVKKKPF